MTAQISNIFEIGEGLYELIGQTNEIDFNPRDYGLVPIMPHTACIRGYFYEAKLYDNKLLITNLFINNKDNNYPKINNVKALDEKKERGFFSYYGINIELNYTGKLLLGSEFIPRYYINMGYKRPYAFKNLIIATFKNGSLLHTEDLSEKALEIRKEIDKDPKAYFEKERDDLEEYIKKSFSLEIEAKYLDSEDKDINKIEDFNKDFFDGNF